MQAWLPCLSPEFKQLSPPLGAIFTWAPKLLAPTPHFSLHDLPSLCIVRALMAQGMVYVVVLGCLVVLGYSILVHHACPNFSFQSNTPLKIIERWILFKCPIGDLYNIQQVLIICSKKSLLEYYNGHEHCNLWILEPPTAYDLREFFWSFIFINPWRTKRAKITFCIFG